MPEPPLVAYPELGVIKLKDSVVGKKTGDVLLYPYIPPLKIEDPNLRLHEALEAYRNGVSPIKIVEIPFVLTEILGNRFWLCDYENYKFILE